MIFFLFLMIGCRNLVHGPATHITEDSIDIYHDFLQHSLGNFDLIEEGRGWHDSTNTYYRWWRLEFLDTNGQTRVFEFDNWISMGEQVANYIRRLSQDEFVREVIETNIANSDDLQFAYLTLHFQIGRARQEMTFDHLTHPETGLQLMDTLEVEYLINQWEFTPRIRVESRVEDATEDTFAQMEKLVRVVAEDLDLDEILVFWGYWVESVRRMSHFRYDRQADIFIETNSNWE